MLKRGRVWRWGGGANDDRFFGQTDTLLSRKISGNRDVTLLWRTEINNEITLSYDTIYCPGHDTTSYEICLFYKSPSPRDP